MNEIIKNINFRNTILKDRQTTGLEDILPISLNF